VAEAFGPIDVWVNAAFTSVFAPFTEIGADEFKRVTEVTCLGYVHGTKVALDHMLPLRHGTIVQVGSALGDNFSDDQRSGAVFKTGTCDNNGPWTGTTSLKPAGVWIRDRIRTPDSFPTS
jgi:NAD(P)-dependent dehydrogenase (short-subunit alcohol dehydrogenase family)